MQFQAHFQIDARAEFVSWSGRFDHRACPIRPIEKILFRGYYSQGYRVMTFLNARIFPLFLVPFPINGGSTSQKGDKIIYPFLLS